MAWYWLGDEFHKFEWIYIFYIFSLWGVKPKPNPRASFNFPRSTTNLWEFHCKTSQNLFLCPNSVGIFPHAVSTLGNPCPVIMQQEILWRVTTETQMVLSWTQGTKSLYLGLPPPPPPRVTWDRVLCFWSSLSGSLFETEATLQWTNVPRSKVRLPSWPALSGYTPSTVAQGAMHFSVPFEVLL